MKMNRRQALLGGIATVLAPRPWADLRTMPLVEWLNKHTHSTTSGPTSPPPTLAQMGGDFIRERMREQGFARKVFLSQKDPNLIGWKMEEVVHGE